jgi:iron complex outermembrane receptor protein
MGKKSSREICGTSDRRLRAAIRQQLIATSIASCMAAPQVARSGDSAGDQPAPGVLAEVTVTAERRTESVIDVPFNISAYAGNTFTDMGVTDLASLARMVPGLSIGERDPAFAAATVPIMRGLNATGVSSYYPQAEQAPVTTYIGDVPVFGYLPLDDVSRVEVLRGPQGTLYGSGSLGGAIRIIPNRPKLNDFNFDVATEGSEYAYAANFGYRVSGLVNVPIGTTIAFRADASYQSIPGYIDQIGVMRRGPGSNGSAVPTLANPSDVADSPGVFYNYPDVNYSGIAAARAALLWQPVEALQANLSFEHARAFGNGFSADNAGYPGGPDEIDPRITQPSLGNYQIIRRGLEPWTRQVDFAALEVSYNVGFATLTSATGYYDSKGAVTFDATGEELNYGPAITPYYAGQPTNPRLLAPALVDDLDHTVTQELRLVSTAGSKLDWTVGGFYQQETRNAFWNYYLPGTYAQTLASGSPDIVTTNPDGSYFNLYRSERFKEKSIFAELTWHLSERAQLTAGARQFWQSFNDSFQTSSTVFLYDVFNYESETVSDHVFKLNTAYSLTDQSKLYATYSQGYRRGGVNAFPLEGTVAEPASLLVYNPDKTDNYEVGIKGTVANRLLYSFDGFYVNWQKAQFDTRTPSNGWPVVENSNGAHSKGVEFEATIKALSDRLTVMMSGEYAKAEFSSNFLLPTMYGMISGTSGERLPGSPEWSAAVTATYQQPLASDRTITYSLSGNVTGNVLNDLQTSQDYAVLRAYSLWNASVMLGNRNGWRVGIFSNNLFDKRVEYGAVIYPLAPQFNDQYVGQPRQIGLRIQYSH